LRDARPDLPDGFVQVVERALASNPKQRYQTAGEFETALVNSTSRAPWSGWVRRAAAVAAVLLLVAIPATLILWSRARADSTSGAAIDPQPAAPPSYAIKASFFSQRDRRDVQLAPGDRIAPGDSLGLWIEASTAVHAYVVTVDDRGEKYLLFPIPGGKLENPLAPGRRHQLPGAIGNEQHLWQVSSAGGREHFLLVASPTALTEFEPMLRALPSPEPGREISYGRVPDDVIGQLRGIGKLVTAPKTAESASPWFAAFDELPREAEQVQGAWIRQLTLVNPDR
jgi:hypothetical protein